MQTSKKMFFVLIAFLLWGSFCGYLFGIGPQSEQAARYADLLPNNVPMQVSVQDGTELNLWTGEGGDYGADGVDFGALQPYRHAVLRWEDPTTHQPYFCVVHEKETAEEDHQGWFEDLLKADGGTITLP